MSLLTGIQQVGDGILGVTEAREEWRVKSGESFKF